MDQAKTPSVRRATVTTARLAGTLETEHITRPMALPVAAAPDRDARCAPHLPGAVPPDERGVLVDAKHHGAAWRLHGHDCRHRFGDPVVVGEHDGAGHDPERVPPPERPWRSSLPQVRQPLDQ